MILMAITVSVIMKIFTLQQKFSTAKADREFHSLSFIFKTESDVIVDTKKVYIKTITS